MLSLTTDSIASTPAIEAQAREFMQLGFRLYDALHLAFAQAASADIFLTTDDRLLKKAKRYNRHITVLTENPVIWLMNTLQEEA